ncbi:MAG: class II aldolase/adducin family protein [Hespellia sp.]|nr:class II aldolase/adducin family protein [Hespellia sp.]
MIAITPSGISYAAMTEADIAIVEMKEDGTNEWIDGPYKPSSEIPMHTAVMRAREDVNATVHIHSMFATIMAMGENAEIRPITPPQCEFPPHHACNSCGYHETEWTTLKGTGMLKSFVFTGLLNARLELEDMGLKYVCGEVQCWSLLNLNLITTSLDMY